MDTREFILSEGRTEVLRAEIAKLNRRADKLGVAHVAMEAIEIEPRRFGGINSQDKTLYAAYKVTLTNPVVTIADYNVSARIDHAEGLIISLREGYAAKYANADPICEHCGENRRRNVTYVLTDSKGNDIQVGSTCLRDFSGAYDAERIAAMLTYYESLCDSAESDDGFSGGGGGSNRTPTAEYLSHVAAMIRLHGWSPKSAYGTPTESLAYGNMYPSPYAKLSDRTAPTADDIDVANRAIEWARGQTESDNDYLRTIGNLAEREYFPNRYSGYVASIVSAFQRAEGKRVEYEMRQKAQAEIIGEIFAPVGTRVRDIPVTVTNIRHFDSDYGVSTLYNMRTEDNHSLSWFASNDPGFKIGETATLTGTVKGYDDKYKSTKMTRCKLT